MDFARIIRLKNKEQVLLTLDFDDDEDVYKVSIHVEVMEARVTLGLVFKEETDARECFNGFSQDEAEVVYKTTVKNFADFSHDLN